MIDSGAGAGTSRTPLVRWRVVTGVMALGVLGLAVARIVLLSAPGVVEWVMPLALRHEEEDGPRAFGRMGFGRGGGSRGMGWQTAGWLPAAKSGDILDDARTDEQFELPEGWQWRELELESDAAIDVSLLPLRQVSSGQYVVEVDFTLETGDGELALMLPLGGGRNCVLAVNAVRRWSPDLADFPTEGHLSSPETFGQRQGGVGDPRPTERWAGFGTPRGAGANQADRLRHAAFSPGERHSLNVVVETVNEPAGERVSLTATFDGQQIFYSGPPSEFSSADGQPWYYADVLGLATAGSSYRIHRLRLTEQ